MPHIQNYNNITKQHLMDFFSKRGKICIILTLCMSVCVLYCTLYHSWLWFPQIIMDTQECSGNFKKLTEIALITNLSSILSWIINKIINVSIQVSK